MTLASMAAVIALLLGLAASSEARTLGGGLLRDAHAISKRDRTALGGNQAVQRRRAARHRRRHARGPRPTSAAPEVAPAPGAPSSGPPAQPSPAAGATTAAPAQAGEKAGSASTPPPPTKRAVEPPAAEEPQPPSAGEPEPPQIDPGEPVEPPAGDPETPPAGEPEPPPAQEPEPPPAEQPEPPAAEEPEPPAEEPEPPPTQEPEPPPTAPHLLFDGARIGDFDLIQAAPGAITEVPDPLGSGETVLKMTVDKEDVAPITPTDNPRAQALSPDLIEAGDEFWLKTKFLIPEGFPTVSGWMSLVSVYGPPFNGSSPWQVEVVGDRLQWTRNRSYGFDVPWSEPLREGVWVSVLLHERFAADGFIEMWVDGQQVSFFGREARLAMQTRDASNDGGPNAAKIMQYREAGMFDTGTLYFGPLLLGQTREAVGG